VREFVDSVNAHGVSCSDTTCGNARLLEYALDAAPAAGVAAADVARARATLEKAIGKRVDAAARELREFAVRNDAREAAASAAAQAEVNAAAGKAEARPDAVPGAAAGAVEQLRGVLLEQAKRTKSAARAAVAASVDESPRAILWLGLPLLGVLVFWRYRYRRLHA